MREQPGKSEPDYKAGGYGSSSKQYLLTEKYPLDLGARVAQHAQAGEFVSPLRERNPRAVMHDPECDDRSEPHQESSRNPNGLSEGLPKARQHRFADGDTADRRYTL